MQRIISAINKKCDWRNATYKIYFSFKKGLVKIKSIFLSLKNLTKTLDLWLSFHNWDCILISGSFRKYFLLSVRQEGFFEFPSIHFVLTFCPWHNIWLLKLLLKWTHEKCGLLNFILFIHQATHFTKTQKQDMMLRGLSWTCTGCRVGNDLMGF